MGSQYDFHSESSFIISPIMFNATQLTTGNKGGGKDNDDDDE